MAVSLPIKDKPSTMDGGYGWVVVFGCCLCNFLLVGISRSMGIFYNLFLDRFGQSAAATSAFLSIYNSHRMILGNLIYFTSRIFT